MLKYAELAQEFDERGYLIIEEFFPLEKIAEIDRELQRFIRQLDPAQSAGRVVYEPNTDGKIRNLFEMEKQDEYFAQLAKAPELVKLASTIFDDEPRAIRICRQSHEVDTRCQRSNAPSTNRI